MDIASIKGGKIILGIKFYDSISIPTSGLYPFYLLPDEVSKLYVDGKQLVDNDGCHGEIEKSGSVMLTKGKHTLKIDYFDNINEETLKLYYGLECSKKEIPLRWLRYE